MTEKFAVSDFLKQAARLIPTNAAKVRTEFEENLRPLVEASFHKLDLVTREEFDRHLCEGSVGGICEALRRLLLVPAVFGYRRSLGQKRRPQIFGSTRASGLEPQHLWHD